MHNNARLYLDPYLDPVYIWVMATFKIIVRGSKKNKEGKAPLVIGVYHFDETEYISTGESIEPRFWNNKKGELRQGKEIPQEAHDAGVIGGQVLSDVKIIRRDLKISDQEPTAWEIKSEWKRRQDEKKAAQNQKESKKKADSKLVSKKVDEWIKNLTHQPLTVKAVTNSMKKFKDFMGKGAEVKDITEEKANEYAKWLFEKKKLAKSSHGRHIKHLRWWIKSLRPLPFDYRDLKMHNFRKKIVSLSLEELKKLEAVDVAAFKEKQKSKDLFLLGCYTGLRISDLRRITKSCVHVDILTGDKELHLTLKKNEPHVEIPILPEAWEILERYDRRAPKIAEHTANTEIKKVCKKAGIDNVIKVTTTKGGKKEDNDVCKYDLITLHVSGKTFISLAEERWGLSISQIASIVGKDPKTISAHYKSLDNKTAKEKMRARLVKMAANQ